MNKGWSITVSGKERGKFRGKVGPAAKAGGGEAGERLTCFVHEDARFASLECEAWSMDFEMPRAWKGCGVQIVILVVGEGSGSEVGRCSNNEVRKYVRAYARK